MIATLIDGMIATLIDGMIDGMIATAMIITAATNTLLRDLETTLRAMTMTIAQPQVIQAAITVIGTVMRMEITSTATSIEPFH